MKRLEHLIVTITNYRWLIAVGILVVMALSAYQTQHKLHVDNSLGIWFLEDDPSYKSYIDFQNQFGSDEIFVGMIPVANALDSTVISKLGLLHKDLDTLQYVNTSYSLATASYPIYANKSITFNKLFNPERSEKSQKRLLEKLEGISEQLLTEDYKNLFFYIQLNPTPTIEEERKGIAKEIRKTISQHFDNYHLTGAPVLNEAYSKGVFKESLVFGILTILVMTIMLLFLLPSRRYLPIALLCVAAPVSILFGIITSLGFSLNMISMLIPTILMVYSVSDAVHIINIYHREGLEKSNYSKTKLITLAIRKSFIPCFYTTLTTFVGYFALYLSPLPAFKNMGVFTCLGLLLAFVLVYVISIIGFSVLSLNFENARPVLSLKQYSHTKTINWLNRFTSNYQNTIILASSLILVLGLLAVFKVPIDTNSLDLLAEGSAKKDLRLVESKLQSSSRLQLNISSKAGTMLDQKALKQLNAFQDKLNANELLAFPVSVVNAISFLEKRTPVLFQSNKSETALKHTLASLDSTSNDFFKLFSKDFKTAGITLGVKELKTSELEQILIDIKTYFKSTFDTSHFELKINGFSVVFSQLNTFILETQFKSFFVAFFVAFLCLWHFIKDLKTTLLVLIPNVLPLSILAIAMSLLDIPLDVSTAMITPIMLGIAMDDTIHLVYKYKRSKTIVGTSASRIDYAMHYTGSALFSTTIALVAGFLIIASSAVPSVRDFGLLCAVTVSIALITDILYLPALLKRYDHRKER